MGKTWLGALLATGWLVAAVPGCSSSDDVTPCTARSCDGFGGGGGTGTPKEGGLIVEVSPPADSGPSRSALCGTMGCFPGNRSACGVNPGDAGYDYGFSDAGDSAVTDGPDGASSDASTDAMTKEDATDASSVSDAPGDMGATDEPRVSQSCYIQPAEGGSGVTTQCAAAGSVGEGGACQDSSDCIALYACVDVDDDHKGGVCRPISCGLPIMCPPGSFYYQEGTLRVSGGSTPLKVPVCLPNDHCMPLSEPNPCTKPLAECAVVGSQGETACIIPGQGKQGDSCDDANRCAKGLLCSKFNNQCVRLCHVAADVPECIGGTCQGGNQSIPEGLGICVGEIPDASR